MNTALTLNGTFFEAYDVEEDSSHGDFLPETAPFVSETGSNLLEIDPFVSPDPGLPVPAPAKVPGARLVVRTTPEFMGWVQGLSDHCSINMTQCVVQGLVRMAELSGYHLRVPIRFKGKNSLRRAYPPPREG
jgi:hypothetical protein